MCMCELVCSRYVFKMHTKLPRSQATEEELREHRSIAPSAAPDGDRVDLNEMRAHVEAAATREACVFRVCEYVWPGWL